MATAFPPPATQPPVTNIVAVEFEESYSSDAMERRQRVLPALQEPEQVCLMKVENS